MGNSAHRIRRVDDGIARSTGIDCVRDRSTEKSRKSSSWHLRRHHDNIIIGRETGKLRNVGLSPSRQAPSACAVLLASSGPGFRPRLYQASSAAAPLGPSRFVSTIGLRRVLRKQRRGAVAGAIRCQYLPLEGCRAL